MCLFITSTHNHTSRQQILDASVYYLINFGGALHCLSAFLVIVVIIIKIMVMVVVAYFITDAALHTSTVLTLDPCLCPCYQPAGIASKWLKRQAGLWHTVFHQPIVHFIWRKFRYLKNKVTSLWNFSPNSGLRKLFIDRSADQ